MITSLLVRDSSCMIEAGDFIYTVREFIKLRDKFCPNCWSISMGTLDEANAIKAFHLYKLFPRVMGMVLK